MKDLNKVNIIITSEDNPSGFSSLKKIDVKVLHFPMIKTIPYSEIKYFDIKKIDYSFLRGNDRYCFSRS